jgi:hypothetical protein
MDRYDTAAIRIYPLRENGGQAYSRSIRLRSSSELSSSSAGSSVVCGEGGYSIVSPAGIAGIYTYNNTPPNQNLQIKENSK